MKLLEADGRELTDTEDRSGRDGWAEGSLLVGSPAAYELLLAGFGSAFDDDDWDC